MIEGLFGQVEADAPGHARLGRRDHLTFRGNVAVGRHGWLRLTPAYSLGLVRQLLKTTAPGELVLDPFSGTGTTPLACAAIGIRCHAVDINPFLVWLANLKLTRFDEAAGRELKAAVNSVVETSFGIIPDPWQPSLHQIEKWWDAPTLHALASLCEGIRRVRQPLAPATADLLTIAFCRVMIQTANVSFGHQSMSFKKKSDDDNGGLIRHTPEHGSRRIAQDFVAAAIEVADSLSVDPPQAGSHVFLGDSRDLPAALPGRGYTTVITSPPYPNRMSYIRELRPYMYWLGFLSDGRAAGELDWKAIGGTWGCATSLLNAWTPNGRDEIPFRHFDRIIQEISARHKLLGRYVHKYFQDMKNHILGLRNVLAPAARCHYIVGNSKFYDTMLPVEGIYAAMFEDAGFAEVTVETIRKRTSKKELYEFIVHAKAPPARGCVAAGSGNAR